MSKLKISELKSIVKDCLIEILSEGLLNSRTTNENVSKKNKHKLMEKFQKRESTPKSSYLDSISYGEIPVTSNNNKRKPRINTNISDNAILNEMFADTAASTLQEQLAAESRKGHSAANVAVQGDQAAKIVAATAPEDLFGDDVASKWSQLAFFDKK